MLIVTLVAFLHIIVAVILVAVVLLQDSKGGGMGGAFGGGSSQTIFGATGAANFLVKVTRVLAVTFMGSCLFLTYYLSQKSNHSVVDSIPMAPTQSSPVQAPCAPSPAAPAQQPATPPATK